MIEQVQPDHIIVDHLAFGARLALTATGTPHADVVLGHPSALTVGDEVYGYPPAFPSAIRPDAAELASLRHLCDQVRDTFTTEWNDALVTLDPAARPSDDAFAETGDVLLLNYPAELHPPARTALLPPHVFLGSAVREEAPDEQVERWLAASDRPTVYVSLGSFLSVRSDVLSRIIDALRQLEVRVALASGSTPRHELPSVPKGWLVRPELPQVRLLQRSVLAVSHGGNNSVTEALTAGVPLVLLPLSTDQFAGAAALERAGFGHALDPNAATSSEIRAVAEKLLALDGEARHRLEALSTSLRSRPGADRALKAIAASPAVG
ncbi:MAG: nucleotide disphospho-sugar-binding domain-containing protein [Dermatophilaceae bacterium]